MIKGIGHIGIAVSDVERTIKSICNALNLTVPEIKINHDKKIKFAVVDCFGTGLEFIEDFSENGNFYKFTKKHGNAIHHFCLLTDDIENDIKELKIRNVLMADNAPKIGLRGKKIAFTEEQVLNGITLELSEP